MIAEHIDLILFVTGAFTVTMLFQVFAPAQALKAFGGLEVSDGTALFFARSAALPIGLFGVLLIWAGTDPAIRTPIIATAAVGKAGFVAMLISQPGHARGFALTIAFDTLCVLVYAAYLLGF
jgi:hypothetical protein